MIVLFVWEFRRVGFNIYKVVGMIGRIVILLLGIYVYFCVNEIFIILLLICIEYNVYNVYNLIIIILYNVYNLMNNFY